MSRLSPKKRSTVVVKSSTSIRTASPLKESVYMNETFSNFQVENQQLQMNLGEKDIEIERMQTTLTALNGKLTELSDIRIDIDAHKEYLQKSEE